MPFENLVGVNIVDPEMYAKYRAAMTPMLEKVGGSFRVDVEVAKVLKSPGDAKFNRLFVIRFPDRATNQAFFSNRDYLRAKAEFFKKGVSDVTILAEYEIPV
jgi:uncharacterized protein (DUF1330 family)